MPEVDDLNAQARKCRILAGGLTNDDDVRTLEELARELEARARAAERRSSASPLAPSISS